MRLEFDPAAMDFSDAIVFGKTYHAPGDLDILQTAIGGSDARERISELSESLSNIRRASTICP